MSIQTNKKCYSVEFPNLQYSFNNRTNQFNKPLKGIGGICYAKPVSFNSLLAVKPTTILYKELYSLIEKYEDRDFIQEKWISTWNNNFSYFRNEICIQLKWNCICSFHRHFRWSVTSNEKFSTNPLELFFWKNPDFCFQPEPDSFLQNLLLPNNLTSQGKEIVSLVEYEEKPFSENVETEKNTEENISSLTLEQERFFQLNKIFWRRDLDENDPEYQPVFDYQIPFYSRSLFEFQKEVRRIINKFEYFNRKHFQYIKLSSFLKKQGNLRILTYSYLPERFLKKLGHKITQEFWTDDKAEEFIKTLPELKKTLPKGFHLFRYKNKNTFDYETIRGMHEQWNGEIIATLSKKETEKIETELQRITLAANQGKFSRNMVSYGVLTFALVVTYSEAVKITKNYLQQEVFENATFLIFPELTNCHVKCHLDREKKHFLFHKLFVCQCPIKKHACRPNWQVDIFGFAKYDVINATKRVGVNNPRIISISWKHGTSNKQSNVIPSNDFNYLFYYSTKKWPLLLKEPPKYGFKKTHDLFFVVENKHEQLLRHEPKAKSQEDLLFQKSINIVETQPEDRSEYFHSYYQERKARKNKERIRNRLLVSFKNNPSDEKKAKILELEKEINKMRNLENVSKSETTQKRKIVETLLTSHNVHADLDKTKLCWTLLGLDKKTNLFSFPINQKEKEDFSDGKKPTEREKPIEKPFSFLDSS